MVLFIFVFHMIMSVLHNSTFNMNISVAVFLFCIIFKIYLFIFGCIGSWLLRAGFL